MKSYKNDILSYALEQYGTEGDRPWARYPDNIVLRRNDNKKWYGLITRVGWDKLGLAKGGEVDIINVKCSPVMLGSLLAGEGAFPAYHMNKSSWVSLLLDGTLNKDTLLFLLDISYGLAGGKKRSDAPRPRREWIVPANARYFNIKTAFDSTDEVLWKQGRGIAAGDIIYLYDTAPISAILYKCEAAEINIPLDPPDEELNISRLMKLRLLHRFDPSELNLPRLRELGVTAIRGPRGVTNGLHCEIEAILERDAT